MSAARPSSRSGGEKALGNAVRAALSALLLGLACTKLPISPAREVEFVFVYQDREGAPIQGAMISIRQIAGSFGGAELTDLAGRASFRLPEGRYHGTAYNFNDAPLPHSSPIPEFLVSQDTGNHVVRLSGVYVSGEIIGPDGSALNGGRISMSTVAPYDYGYTDFSYDGPTFRALVEPKTYRIWVSGGPSPSPYPTATIDSVSFVSDTTLTFRLVGIRVEGQVTGRGGAPIPGARVHASGTTASATGTADAVGGYFLYVPAGSYRWTISPPDSMRHTLGRYEPSEAITAPTTRDFSLDGAAWSGTVVTDGSGAPQAGLWVVASPWQSNRSAVSLTDETGAFYLVLERGLEYDIHVQTYPYEWNLRSYRAGVANADSTFTLTAPAPSSAPRAVARRR